MAFPDPLALKNAAAAAVSLARYGAIPNGNLYQDVAATPTVKTKTSIRRISNPKKGDSPATNRHIVTFSRDKVGTDTITRTVSLSLSLNRPVSSDIADTDVSDLFAMLNEFLIVSAGDYKARFIRGEV